MVAAAASPAAAAVIIHGGNPNTWSPPVTTTSIVDEFASGMAAADDGVGTLDEVLDTPMIGSMMPRMFPLADTAAMPEPQAWALMLTGFTAAGTLLRSRRRRPQFISG